MAMRMCISQKRLCRCNKRTDSAMGPGESPGKFALGSYSITQAASSCDQTIWNVWSAVLKQQRTNINIVHRLLKASTQE